MEPDYILEGGGTYKRKARKEHQCDECGGGIAVGEVYTYICGKNPDGYEVYRRCPDCVALIEDIEPIGEQICLGYLTEFLGNSLCALDEKDRAIARRFNDICTRRGTEPLYEESWFEEGEEGQDA